MFRKKKEIKQRRTFASAAFFLAIFASFLLGSLELIHLVSLAHEYGLSKEIWFPFICGFIGALTLSLSMKVPKLRVFIHEAKHAIVVAFTGNKVTDFKVDERTGHVSYEMYKRTLHFEPFIVLAPYFFPLFSFPAFIFAIVLENYYRVPMILILGAALAVDFETAIRELHRHQSDLKTLIGGFFLCALFLAGFSLFWLTTCLLWVLNGNAALLSFLATLMTLLADIAREFHRNFLEKRNG